MLTTPSPRNFIVAMRLAVGDQPGTITRRVVLPPLGYAASNEAMISARFARMPSGKADAGRSPYCRAFSRAN